MLEHRFLRAGSKGIEYNETYFGTKSSFNSYISAFESSIEKNETDVEKTDENFQQDLGIFQNLKDLHPSPRIRRQHVVHKSIRDKPENNEKDDSSVSLVAYLKDTKHRANLEKFENILKTQHQSRNPKIIVELADHDQHNRSQNIKTTQNVSNHKSSKENIENAAESGMGVVGGQSSQSALDILQSLKEGNNLVKFLEANGFSTSGISVPQLKQALDRFLTKNSDIRLKEISKYERQLQSLKELTDDAKLEKWLESKGVPTDSVSLPKIKDELQRYFQPTENRKRQKLKGFAEPFWGRLKKDTKSEKDLSIDYESDDGSISPKLKAKSVSTSNISGSDSESKISDKSSSEKSLVVCDPSKRTARNFGVCQPVEEFNGRSLVYRENTLAKKLWDDFMEMSAPKQVAVVVGITVVTAALGFVSWRILLMAFPSMFSANHYWTEVLAQWFIQRQESTYHLLSHTAENAKPLSHTWANQYILWKYI